jgi:hypothetical protein
VIHDKIASVVGREGQLEALCTKGGRLIELDQLFSQQGATPQTSLAEQLGVRLSDNDYIAVDTEQKTSVPGVYAAGDVTRLHSHQVTTAVHEGRPGGLGGEPLPVPARSEGRVRRGSVQTLARWLSPVAALVSTPLQRPPAANSAVNP